MLTGAVPFEAENLADVMRLHLTSDPLPLRSRAEGLSIPPALDALVIRMLAKVAEYSISA